MLDKESIEIYNLDEDRETKLWKDCIFVFDSSAMLSFYDYTKKTVDSVFNEIFPKIVERLWIPKQVEYEFLKNRERTINQPIEKYSDLLSNNNKHLKGINCDVEDFIKLNRGKFNQISSNFNDFKEKTNDPDKHPYLEKTIFNEFENDLSELNNLITVMNDGLILFQSKFKTFTSIIDQEIDNKKNNIKNISQEDHIFKGFNKYFTVGKDYTFDKLMEICIEGEWRYRLQIPPGYADKSDKTSREDNKTSETGNKSRGKIGIDLYGDLILWKQIIDYVTIVKKHIIFISNDVKIDWCHRDEQDNQRINKPRQELIKELYSITGMELWMYSLRDFILRANKILKVNLDKQTLNNVEESRLKDLENLENPENKESPTSNVKTRKVTLNMVSKELQRFQNLIGKIDYDVPEIRQHMHTDSIFDEKFGAGIPSVIESQVKRAIQQFQLNPSQQNLDKLIEAYDSLVQLNKDFFWAIYTYTGEEFN